MIMNKQGKGPNLTTLIIGVVIFIGVMLLIFSPYVGMYNVFMDANAITIGPQEMATYTNLTSNKQNLGMFAANLTTNTNNVVENLDIILKSAFAVGALGVKAVQSFIVLPVIMLDIVNSFSSVTHLPSAFVWLITTALMIYVASKILKSVRGTQDEV